jgi:hypothetical protein
MAMTGNENASIRSGGQQTPTKRFSARGGRDIAAAHERKSKCGGAVTFAVGGVTTSVANVEAVIGQLCPAALLARGARCEPSQRTQSIQDICSRRRGCDRWLCLIGKCGNQAVS